MPRGTRAVHGHNVQGGVHGRGNTHQELYASIPETGWLHATCWCEKRIVAVTQADVVERGITYACGSLTCLPPEGIPYQAGLIQWDMHFTRQGTALISSRMEGEMAKVRVHLRKKETIKKREQIAERRDRIRVMYLKGKQFQYIAKKLGLKYQTVQVDVMYMRKKGLL